MEKNCDFGKKVKKKLVDIDKNQTWLRTEVEKDTGLYVDSAYMSRVLSNRAFPPKIVASICKILGIEE